MAKKAFTLVEILTVIVIITILVGVLMPALNQVKKLAKETKEKAQIGSIEIAVNLYRNDFGEYPPSHGSDDAVCSYPGPTKGYAYCGAQTLTEAMFGQDLLGFHPESVYRADGFDSSTTPIDLYPDPFNPDTVPAHAANLEARKDPYLDRTNIDVFTPFQIFNRNTCDILEPDIYVICDVFTAVSRQINGRTYKIGTPVLYFRANLSPVNTDLIPNAANNANNIYDYTDSKFLMQQGKITDENIKHPLCLIDDGSRFYDFITDPMVPSLKRPVRPDSFILISAGNDGLYGTRDDICNFEPNLPG